jgi:hypothetical protein
MACHVMAWYGMCLVLCLHTWRLVVYCTASVRAAVAAVKAVSGLPCARLYCTEEKDGVAKRRPIECCLSRGGWLSCATHAMFNVVCRALCLMQGCM